jgi:hypothetical protein
MRRSSPVSSCPRCGHIPEPGCSFADLNPAVVKEWHPRKNGGTRPDELKPNSAFRAWWKCLARGHEWEAAVSNRSGSEDSSCPTCVMWGTSASQIRLAYELRAAGIPVVLDHPKIPVVGRRPVAADIVIPDYSLIVEYDGSYHHARPEALEQDRRQSKALEGAGWTVLRLRPEAIEPIDEFSIEVANGASIKTMATAVLQRIDGLGHAVDRLVDYETGRELWAAAEADAAVLNLKSRSLMHEFPDIAAEWHPTRNGLRKPDDINLAARFLHGGCARSVDMSGVFDLAIGQREARVARPVQLPSGQGKFARQSLVIRLQRYIPTCLRSSIQTRTAT